MRKYTLRQALGIITLSLVFIFSALSAEPVQVLYLGFHKKPDARLTKELAKQNVHLHFYNVTEPLTPEMLRLFHVAFFPDNSETQSGNMLDKFVANDLTIKRNLELIEAYVRDGGGYFFEPDSGGQPGTLKQNRYLKPYGIEIMPLQVRDDAHRYVPAPPPRRDAGYSWTDNIAKHPAAKGVKTIFYPTPQHRWDDLYSTMPLKLLDPAWKPLVTGMDSATASWTSTYTNWQVIDDKPPVIAAVRDFGKGRMAILGITPYYTVFVPYWKPKDHKWGRGQIRERTTGDLCGIFVENGDGTRTSDGRQLLISMFRYLAKPARQAGFGGYSKKALAALEVPEKPKAPHWINNWELKPKLNNYKIFLGARSEYGGGKGTLEAYKEAARKAGITMLCFAEDFQKFDGSRWREYYSRCKELSDDEIALVPGLEVRDQYGARYIALNSTAFPSKQMLAEDNGWKYVKGVEQFSLNFPDSIIVAHRIRTCGNIPHQLIKHYQGISIFTYDTDGKLIDNSFPAYEWQVYAQSNPLPLVVHYVDAPEKLGVASKHEFQVYGAAPTTKDLIWNFVRRGNDHFWANPLRLQVSSGPLLTAFGRKPYLQIESPKPLKEVRLWKNFELFRRWLPKGNEFTVEHLFMPTANLSWFLLTAQDSDGGRLISSGRMAGPQVGHTWRCGDRQNWWAFPNIYTGTYASGFDLDVPVFGSVERTGSDARGFPHQLRKGERLRGGNLAAILEFSFAGQAVYIQDAHIDQRYSRAAHEDIVFDAKPANATVRSNNYRARIRYHDFKETTADGKKREYTKNRLPMMKEVDIVLRRPVTPETNIFPQVTTMLMKNHDIRGDWSYEYTDPETGKQVKGILKGRGVVDLPRGGYCGGLLVLDGTLRVGRNMVVGFPAVPQQTLPAETAWYARFIVTPPKKMFAWRKLCGFEGKMPYAIKFDDGKFLKRDLVTYARADGNGAFSGAITKPLPGNYKQDLVSATLTERNLKRSTDPLQVVELPFYVEGANPNISAVVWRDNGRLEQAPIFEGTIRARIDVERAGKFFIGNALICSAPQLRIGLGKWTADTLEIDINNSSDKAIEAKVWTAPAIKDRIKMSRTVSLAPGSSKTITYSSK